MSTSRFSVTDAPSNSPGVCYITRTSVGPFIDTGVDMSTQVIDRGRLYLAVDVIREMAQLAGLFEEERPVTVELLEKEWFEKGYNQAIKELKNDVVDNFVSRVLSEFVSTAGGATPVAPSGRKSTAGAAISDVEESARGTHEVVETDDDVERKSTGTGSVKRPARVPTNSSDESNYRL